MKFFNRFTKTIILVYITTLSSASFALQTNIISKELRSPWALAQVPGSSDVLITEKAGRLVRLSLVSGHLEAITQINDVKVQGQGGLMDIAIAADFASSGLIYFSYAKGQGDKSATTLARAVLDRSNQQWQLKQWQDLLVTIPASDSGRHFGSRIAFDNNGHVFFTVGDRGERSNGQNLSTHSGSILRLNLDGSIPFDNPFINKNNALPEIFSYGHRNPQGLSFVSEHAQLFAIEHGPRGGDEINVISAGKNYGWPIISYGKEYWGPISVGEGTAKKGMQQPLMQYTPSIAPSSLLYYQSDYFAELKNSFLAGALALRHLSQVRFTDGLPAELPQVIQPHSIKRWLTEQERRIRDITTLEDGRLVVLSDRGEVIIISKE